MKPYIVLIGFILFILGILSLILRLCGMQFIFMSFIQSAIGDWSMLVYAIMTLVGITMAYVTMSPTRLDGIPEEH